jgi:mono/diheme cytochrome c family protein
MMRLIAAMLILPASVAALLWLAASEFGGSQATADASAEDDPGRKIYMTRCISCHQANGKGITGYFPPLDGTEWVAEEKGRLIRIVLQGMTGRTTVQGVDYNGAMPAWGPVLTDAEVAGVLTYIRSTWSNDFSPVTESDVTAVRALTAGRTKPWTHAELMSATNRTTPGAEDSESNTDTDPEG